MGTVWRAWDERLKRQVAIKQVLSDSVPNARERLRREAQAAARLNHPAIVQVYDLVEREDGEWIVLELVNGRTLRGLIDEEGPLDPSRALQLGRDVAEGLAEAHAHGILHRDLKTSNVMVTPAGRAKILDFGIAKEIADGPAGDLSLSTPGTILGTFHAMSPEQAQGLRLDARSDLFSLGSLLYEALTGSPPFLAGTPRETLTRVLSYDPPPLDRARPGIPRELSGLVRRLLEKEPADRPRSAAEVAGDLSALLGTLPGRPAPAKTVSLSGHSGEVTLVEGLRTNPPAASGAGRQIGERRRLTVVCCGLVSVDDASGEIRPLDVEALSEAMTAVQALAAEVAGQLDGHLGAVLGNLLWLYFGYPRAYEDNAQRAVRAARLLSDRIEQIGLRPQPRQRLAVRIAVHTGPAVIRTGPGAAEQLQLGSTLDLATGLQSAVPARTVVASAESQRLIARSFSTEALAPVRLPGFDEPVPLYRVLEAVDLREGTGEAPSPLVSRERELGLLLDRFRLARSGNGQAVMISGEAGIGKSRLLRALREGLADAADIADDAAWLIGYGSPYTQSSPLFPIVELLERSVFAAAGTPPEEKLERLEEVLRHSGLPLAENVPILASLLSVPTAGRYPPLGLSLDMQRRKTLETLVALLAQMAERRPQVMVIEDLHWIDPSTLELLDLLLEEIPAVPLMLVVTFRPDFQAAWRHREHITQIGLGRLTDGEAEALIDRLAERSSLNALLPAEVRRQILDRTDGVPLFIEELTKAVLESGWDGENLDIPSTLDGSLMARLDRLGDAKEVAQLASVIGRVFSLDLLEAVSQLEAAVLRRGLGELLRAELVRRRGVAQPARYVFKHALIQDAAYLSLLNSQRQQIHGRIARALTDLSRTQEVEPEILAHHFEKAGLVPEATVYLQQAALRALGRSAYSEASSHCRKAIELLASPASPPMREQELALRSTLGLALVPVKGYASKEVAENAARIEVLCREVGDTPRLIPSLYGLWGYHRLRGHRKPTLDLAEELGRRAVDGDEHSFIGFAVRGTTAYYAGDLPAARILLEKAVSTYRLDLQPRLAQAYGEDAGVLPHFYYFWCVWLCGRPDEGARKKDESMEIVAALSSSPYVLATGRFFEMTWWHELREPEELRQVAEGLIELCREQRYPFFLSLATCAYGWALVHRGEAERGLALMQEGLKNYTAIGTKLARAYWLSYLVEAYLHVGMIEEGMAAVEEALAMTATQIDVFHDAELHRLRGELLLRVPDVEGADAAFRQALEIARRQGALMFELRTATSLARLLRGQGRTPEARTLLADVYGTFQEGFATRDLREARELLDELEIRR